MQRRSFLGAVAASTAAAVSGCTALSDEIDRAGTRIEQLRGGSPWGDGPVVVAVESEASRDRPNFPDLVAEAAAYWEEHAERYAGFEISYEFRAVDDPDVRVVLVDRVSGCPEHESEYVTVGCAPLITGSPPDTARVEIKSGYSDGLTLTTIKHEFGHTLGLDHDDEPAEIMSHDPADRIPDYETRRAIHDAYLTGIRRVNRGTDAWNEGHDEWTAENWTAAESSFATAAERYDAGRTSFEAARADAAEIGADRAVDLCRRAREFAAAYVAAAEAIAAAAAALADGDRSRANERYEEYETHREEVRGEEIAGSDAVARALGLQ